MLKTTFPHSDIGFHSYSLISTSQIDSQPLNASARFAADVQAKMLQPPYNCPDCTTINMVCLLLISDNLCCVSHCFPLQNSSQVSELADAMLLYALALNKSISAGYPNPTGTELAQFASGTFEGNFLIAAPLLRIRITRPASRFFRHCSNQRKSDKESCFSHIRTGGQ